MLSDAHSAVRKAEQRWLKAMAHGPEDGTPNQATEDIDLGNNRTKKKKENENAMGCDACEM
jgi:hypothetical protein